MPLLGKKKGLERKGRSLNSKFNRGGGGGSVGDDLTKKNLYIKKIINPNMIITVPLIPSTIQIFVFTM